MIFAGPVGQAPAGRIFLDRCISRASIFAAVGVLAALNAQADQITSGLSKGSTFLLIDLGGISAIIWFAMFAAIRVGVEGQSRSLTVKDVTVLAGVVILCFVPFSFAAKAALFFVGLYLFATASKDSSSRRVSLVLLALTGPLMWGRVVLTFFAAPILALDAHIVAGAIGSKVQDNLVVTGRSQGLLVAEPCSSVHNISLAIVLWTTVAVLLRVRLDRRYAGVGLAMVAWMFSLNVVRLGLIALYPSDYEFLHFGNGAVLFGWAGLICAAVLAGFGAIRAVERQQ